LNVTARTLYAVFGGFELMIASQRIALLTMVFFSALMVGASLPGILFSGPHSQASTPFPNELDPLSDHVLLLVLDGVPRSVFDDADVMPFTASFDKIGVKAPVQTSELTLTGACIKEMATGRKAVPMDAIRNWEVSNEIRNDPFYHAEYQGGSVAFTGFYVWQNMYPEDIFLHETSPDFGFEDISLADDYAMNVVNGWVNGDHHQLMVAHLGGTDHAAHIHGLESEIYKERLRELDRELEDLFSSVPDDWTVLLTSDHGLTNYGGHALGTGAAAEEVYLFAKGPGIALPGVLDSAIDQRDISPLLSSLLGLPLPTSSDAVIPLDMLDLTQWQREQYEQWNWENILAHHAFMESEGGDYIGGLPDDPEWALLDKNEQRLPYLPLLLSLGIVAGLIAWTMANKTLLPITFVNTRYQGALIAVVSIVFILMATVVREQELLSSGRWIRKLLGTLGIGALMAWMVFDRKRVKQLQLPYAVLVTFALLFFYPETRYSMVAISLAPVALYAVWTNGKNHFLLQEKLGISVLFGLMTYHLVDYLPRFLTGMSLQALLDIDLLYKPMQRLVHASMVTNPLYLLMIALVAFGVLFVKKTDGGINIDVRPVLCLSGVLGVAMIQRTFTDWILLAVVLYATFSSLNDGASERFRTRFGISPAESILLCWVGPTWGFYPAFSVVFIGRIIPSLRNMLASFFEGEESSNANLLRHSLNALVGVSLLFLVWFHFSLLTPLGLLEYNPSKAIVTGGFFGARNHPPIVWMALMIAGPLLMSLGYTYFSWTELDENDHTMLLVGMFILSHSVMYWTAAAFTEYFVMLSTALLFYSTVLFVGLFVEGQRWLKYKRRIATRSLVQ
jgi:hypothetical protein